MRRDHRTAGNRNPARLARATATTIAGIAVLAAPLQAGQRVAPPAVRPTLPPTSAAPQTVAPPAPQPVVPLPVLSPAQADQVRSMLASNALAQGLRYDAPPPGAGPAPVSDNAALVRAALDHAHAVHAGRLDASDFDGNWGMKPPAFDPLPGFADAVRRDRIPAWFASLPPPYSGYDGLVKGLATYRAIVAAGGWAKLDTGPDLSLGSKGPRVLALRQRLAIEDPMVVATGDSFDADLQAAVQRAQRRYGLNPQGVASSRTIAALNVPAADRVRQIMANLERWRWLPEELPRDRIQVNIAAAVLTVFDGDVPILSMKGVTGAPGHETPMLTSTIKSIVINPPWNVPTSIATNELWPKERKNPGYLKRNGFKVIGDKGLQQAAGNQSALGRYKFDFDNPYSVYLHDTPSHAKFASFDRLASHGCVRLERPADLAALLLKGDLIWTPDQIAAAVKAGKTQRVSLGRPVQVYLLYWTAFASANGQMNFRDDPYHWDSSLAAKVEARSAHPLLTLNLKDLL